LVSPLSDRFPLNRTDLRILANALSRTAALWFPKPFPLILAAEILRFDRKIHLIATNRVESNVVQTILGE
jgi:hypothetical protein